MFFTAYVLCGLRLVKFRLKANQYKQKTSPKSYKTEIKILANPGGGLIGLWTTRPWIIVQSTGSCSVLYA